MISSIFGKSKPINYIIILGFLFLFYAALSYDLLSRMDQPEQLFLHVVVLGILLFSIMIVNFIVKRNQISGTNDFTIFYYSLLIVLFPDVLLDYNAIMSSFFLLLALRRLISLKSLRSVKLKLFDSTFWIMVGSLFYDWVLLFLLLVYIGIYIYEPKNFRNWLVPLVSLACFVILLYSFIIITGNTSFASTHYQFEIYSESNLINSIQGGLKIFLYTILVMIAGIVSFVKLRKLGMGKVVTMRLVAIAFVLGIVVTFFKSSESVAPIILTFLPAAVLFTKYVEVIKRINIKEVTLILSLVIPFMVFLGELIAK